MARSVDPATVSSRDDFVIFLQALVKDLNDHPRGDTNDTTVVYLEAMSGWVADMDGAFKNWGQAPPSSPTWKLFAQIILAATVYD